jgi:hypothetical protein
MMGMKRIHAACSMLSTVKWATPVEGSVPTHTKPSPNKTDNKAWLV